MSLYFSLFSVAWRALSYNKPVCASLEMIRSYGFMALWWRLDWVIRGVLDFCSFNGRDRTATCSRYLLRLPVFHKGSGLWVVGPAGYERCILWHSPLKAWSCYHIIKPSNDTNVISRVLASTILIQKTKNKERKKNKHIFPHK